MSPMVPFYRRTLLLTSLCLTAVACASAQRVRPALPRDDGWVDQTPHKSGFITVQRGVRIHYLDFGGTGPALFLVPGIGNTAHAYDDFAPGLTDRFHVYAMTRRGFGESSHPAKGYDIPRLAQDIRTVMDSLHLTQVELVGHSFAGQEMTHFVRAYPARVHKLVYLDGAFDNIAVDSVSQTVFTAAMPYPPKPPLTDDDTATYRAYVDYVHSSRGVNIPESDIRVRVKYDGIIEELGVGYQGIGREAATERQHWETLRHPGAGDLRRARLVRAVGAVGDRGHVVARRRAGGARQVRRSRGVRGCRLQASSARRGLVVHGGHHWVFVSHREQVLKAVRAFLLRPS